MIQDLSSSLHEADYYKRVPRYSSFNRNSPTGPTGEVIIFILKQLMSGGVMATRVVGFQRVCFSKLFEV